MFYLAIWGLARSEKWHVLPLIEIIKNWTEIFWPLWNTGGPMKLWIASRPVSIINLIEGLCSLWHSEWACAKTFMTQQLSFFQAFFFLSSHLLAWEIAKKFGTDFLINFFFKFLLPPVFLAWILPRQRHFLSYHPCCKCMMVRKFFSVYILMNFTINLGVVYRSP